MKTLIKEALIVTVDQNDTILEGNVLIEDDRIACVSLDQPKSL